LKLLKILLVITAFSGSGLWAGSSYLSVPLPIEKSNLDWLMVGKNIPRRSVGTPPLYKRGTKEKIVSVCTEIGASVPVTMAIASIETGGKFHANAKDKGGACVGIYQLKTGFGGCVGDDRYCVVKSTKALWNAHRIYKKRWLEEFGEWDDFYYYGIHQKGYAGFKEIYKNRDKKLTEISAVRRRSIMLSKPKKAEWTLVIDWWNYYEKKFYRTYNLYN
jgi:hypothetical protein